MKSCVSFITTSLLVVDGWKESLMDAEMEVIPLGMIEQDIIVQHSTSPFQIEVEEEEGTVQPPADMAASN